MNTGQAKDTQNEEGRKTIIMGKVIGINERYLEGTDKQYKLEHDIDDPELLKAVMYACSLIDKDSKTIDEAVCIAGKYYKQDMAKIRLNLPRAICEEAPADENTNYRLYLDINLSKVFGLVAVIFSKKNMCCCENNPPYLLTKCKYTDGTEIFSCQCSCGGWCTNGHSDPADAIEEYESMCDRYIKSHKRKH